MAREYGTSVETTASPDRVWKIWSDMSTWGEWNPNVSTMDWQTVEVGGLLGPVMGPILGPQVSKEFGPLLDKLAKKAESS